jgi:hypothetical protein
MFLIRDFAFDIFVHTTDVRRFIFSGSGPGSGPGSRSESGPGAGPGSGPGSGFGLGSGSDLGLDVESAPASTGIIDFFGGLSSSEGHRGAGRIRREGFGKAINHWWNLMEAFEVIFRYMFRLLYPNIPPLYPSPTPHPKPFATVLASRRDFFVWQNDTPGQFRHVFCVFCHI